jgi:hypothetical protein
VLSHSPWLAATASLGTFHPMIHSNFKRCTPKLGTKLQKSVGIKYNSQSMNCVWYPYHYTLDMSALKFCTLFIVSFLVGTATSSPALSAIQHVNPRDEYQGGWPLSLEGTNSGSCPTDASTQCSSTNVNPQCCPSGQTCFWGAVQFANYCCPTGANSSPLLSVLGH